MSFNPRTRVGCDRPDPAYPAGWSKFQSTHPRGVRRSVTWTARPRALRFNPRTRVGCDGGGVAPGSCPELVSIHAPAWGATAICVSGLAPSGRFNPRTRVGCDRFQGVNAALDTQFQSTHPRGVRRECISIAVTGCVFQSTHPRGVRRAAAWLTGAAWSSFNPRTRVGCDGLRSGGLARHGQVSIHAPAWGATTARHCGCCSKVLFQSTHPRGVRRRAGRQILRQRVVSIHAPAWGATVSMFYPVDSCN